MGWFVAICSFGSLLSVLLSLTYSLLVISYITVNFCTPSLCRILIVIAVDYEGKNVDNVRKCKQSVVRHILCSSRVSHKT